MTPITAFTLVDAISILVYIIIFAVILIAAVFMIGTVILVIQGFIKACKNNNGGKLPPRRY